MLRSSFGRGTNFAAPPQVRALADATTLQTTTAGPDQADRWHDLARAAAATGAGQVVRSREDCARLLIDSPESRGDREPARLLWAKLVKDFGATKDKSLSLRTHSQTSGWSLAAQDVFNNVPRTMVEAMAAAGGQTQSLHTNALDEAIALPTDFSARIARNTQILLQQETGLTRVIDPWGGSFYVERLTHELAERARAHMAEVEALVRATGDAPLAPPPTVPFFDNRTDEPRFVQLS